MVSRLPWTTEETLMSPAIPAHGFPVTAGAYQTSFAAGCPYPAFTIATGTIGTIAEWLVDDVFVVKPARMARPRSSRHCSRVLL